MRLETRWQWYEKTEHGHNALYILHNASGGGCVHGYERRVLKSGKRSTKSMVAVGYGHFTPLIQCDNCGRVSTPKNIQLRWLGIYGKIKKSDTLGEHHFSGDLCMSCYNKLRPVYQNYKDINETRKLLNKLKRTINDVNKNQNHRTIERISCQHDNGCEGR